MIWIWSSSCHCHLITSCSNRIQNGLPISMSNLNSITLSKCQEPEKKLELKIFTKHTPHTSRHQCVLPSPPGGKAMVSSAAACSIWPMAHASLCIINGDDSTVFRFLSLMTLSLTFKLVRARDQTHFPCEFGANPFRPSPKWPIVSTGRLRNCSLAGEKHGHWTPWMVGHTEKNCYYTLACNVAK